MPFPGYKYQPFHTQWTLKNYFFAIFYKFDNGEFYNEVASRCSLSYKKSKIFLMFVVSAKTPVMGWFIHKTRHHHYKKTIPSSIHKLYDCENDKINLPGL